MKIDLLVENISQSNREITDSRDAVASVAHIVVEYQALQLALLAALDNIHWYTQKLNDEFLREALAGADFHHRKTWRRIYKITKGRFGRKKSKKPKSPASGYSARAEILAFILKHDPDFLFNELKSIGDAALESGDTATALDVRTLNGRLRADELSDN